MLERGRRLEEASRGTNGEIVGHLPAENIQQYKLHSSENMLEICEGCFFPFSYCCEIWKTLFPNSIILVFSAVTVS